MLCLKIPSRNTVSSSPVQVLFNVDKQQCVYKLALNRWFERTFSLFFCSNKIDLLGLPLSKAHCFRIYWINNAFNANIFQTFWGKPIFCFVLENSTSSKSHESSMIMDFNEPRWLAMKNYQATGGPCFSNSPYNNVYYLLMKATLIQCYSSFPLLEQDFRRYIA